MARRGQGLHRAKSLCRPRGHLRDPHQPTALVHKQQLPPFQQQLVAGVPANPAMLAQFRDLQCLGSRLLLDLVLVLDCRVLGAAACLRSSCLTGSSALQAALLRL